MESSLGKNPQSENNYKNKNFDISNNKDEKNSIETLFYKLIRRKKILIIILISFIFFGFIRTTREKIFNSLYEGSFSLLIEDPINNLNKGDSNSLQSIFNTSSSLEQNIPTLREVLLSQYLLEDISKQFNMNYLDLADRIRIEQDTESSGVLEIYFESNNPQKDIKLLDQLSTLFVNYASQQKKKKLNDGLKFLSSQEPSLKEKYIAKSVELENFMKKNNIVDPLVESQKKKVDIKGLETKITLYNSNIKRLETIREEILKENSNMISYREFIGDSIDSSDLRITEEESVSKELKLLNQELSKAKLIYTPNSSVIRNYESRIKLLRPILKKKQLEIIDKSIKSTKDIIEIRKSMLMELNNEFKELTDLIRDYQLLTFELQAAIRNIEGLNEAKESLQLQIAQDSNPWTIIRDPIFKNTRIYPSFRKELTNFALMGIFTGIGLSLLRDKFDDVYHSPEEIKEEINYPLLGHIPYIEFFSKVREEKRSIVDVLIKDDEEINSYDKFFYQEALRNIYTSIRFLNSDKPIRIVTMTSSIPKEGKSLSSILLAKTLCEMDLKILQIDADLRKPQLHTRLKLNNITGLSNIITNDDIKISDAIQSVSGFDNWEVITSGFKPPDPTRLLQSKKMDNIISSIKKSGKYDLVLIDTPPVIGLADSLLMSEKSDGLILIVTTDQVPRVLPKESISKTLSSGANFLGIISNSTKKTSNQILNNYRYKYAYTYNSYIEEENVNKDKKAKISKYDTLKDDFLKNAKIISSKFFKWLDS